MDHKFYQSELGLRRHRNISFIYILPHDS